MFDELFPADEAHELALKELVFLGIVAGHLARKNGPILVFSQFTAVLQRLQEVLAKRGIKKVALFTGATPE